MSFSFRFTFDPLGHLILLLLFFGAHLFKFIRFYLVLMEERELSFFDIMFLYVRTTFVNLVIPYKAGEIYRVAAVWHKTRSFKTGVLSVVVDRFFDTLSLLLIILPFQVFFMRSINPVTGILFAALIILIIAYLSYYPSYRYLNRYLIMTKSSKRSLFLLDLLDRANEWYVFMRKLIRGRGALMILSSLTGWGLEFAALRVLASSLGNDFTIDTFISYIDSLLSGGKNGTGSVYNLMGSVIFLILTVFFICYSMSRKNSAAGKES